MRIRDDLFIIILLVTWLFLSGCQEPPSFENRSKSSATIDAKGNKGDENAEEEFGVDEPISVGGAFLFCAFDDAIAASSEDQSIVGCRLKDQNDRPIVLERDFEVTTILVSADGFSRREIERSAISNIFWHWVYEAPTSEVAGGKIEMSSNAEGVIWGEVKVVQIAESDNDLQSRLNLVYMMIDDYEISLANLEKDLDYRKRRLEKNQVNEKNQDNEKTVASRALQSATSQHQLTETNYDEANREVTNFNTQWSTAVSEKEKVTKDLAAAQAVLTAAEQAVIDAPTPENISAAEAARTNVQAADTNLINATAKESQIRQLLEDSIGRSDDTKSKMDVAKAQRDTAQNKYNEKFLLHQSALSALERATKKHEEALAARDKVARELADLQAEAERLKNELASKSR